MASCWSMSEKRMVFKIHLGHLRLDVLPALGPEAVILLGELGILDFLLDHVRRAAGRAEP